MMMTQLSRDKLFWDKLFRNEFFWNELSMNKLSMNKLSRADLRLTSQRRYKLFQLPLLRFPLLHFLWPLLLLPFNISLSIAAETISPQRAGELRNLLEQDCGSCHGITLKGGLGPALTSKALKDKSIEQLSITIREGRPDTPMPPWKHLLSDADINWLAQTLKQ
jgi:cytochrome c55X